MPADEEVGVVDRVVADIVMVLVGDEQAEYQVATASFHEGVARGRGGAQESRPASVELVAFPASSTTGDVASAL